MNKGGTFTEKCIEALSEEIRAALVVQEVEHVV
jgi:hypothetical protein